MIGYSRIVNLFSFFCLYSVVNANNQILENVKKELQQHCSQEFIRYVNEYLEEKNLLLMKLLEHRHKSIELSRKNLAYAQQQEELLNSMYIWQKMLYGKDYTIAAIEGKIALVEENIETVDERILITEQLLDLETNKRVALKTAMTSFLMTDGTKTCAEKMIVFMSYSDTIDPIKELKESLIAYREERERAQQLLQLMQKKLGL